MPGICRRPGRTLGAALAMRAALTDAGLEPSQIDYVNLHGTATHANDLAEDAALLDVFNGEVLCSSTKGFTAHALGAAGIVEALFSYIAIENNVAFRSLNTANVDERIRSPTTRNCTSASREGHTKLICFAHDTS